MYRLNTRSVRATAAARLKDTTGGVPLAAKENMTEKQAKAKPASYLMDFGSCASR